MAKKKTVKLSELMQEIDMDVRVFMHVAPSNPDDEVQQLAHAMILNLRHTRLKFLNEPDGRKRLRPQIDELGIHIFKVLRLLTERDLDHPPKCGQQLREAGLL